MIAVYRRLTERVGVFTGGVNVGIIEGEDDRVLLVDTGANESNARKLLRCVRDDIGKEVSGILSTHGHADHFGGHAFVAKRTGAEVHAPAFESTVLKFPSLQPSLLFGGAAPPAALRERFILADASPVHHEIEPGTMNVDGVQLEVIALHGHSPRQVGFVVDGVFFCADVVFPAAAIEKYRIPYLFDLGQHIASMEWALAIEAQHIVPSHGPIERDLNEPVRINRAIIDETLACMREALREPMGLEEVANSVFERMEVPMMGHVSFYLLRPTIAAYLSYMEDQGAVEHFMDGKVAKWRSV